MRVTFWFDPVCPFTWSTSRWLVDVAGRRDVEVTWQVMSLAILNADNEVPEQFREAAQQAPRAHRVLVAAERAHGTEALGRLYTALGSRLHEKGERIGPDLLAGALADAGLPDELRGSMDDESLDPLVQRSHDEAQARVGTASGSPVLAIGDRPAYFGPVVTPVPEGAAADRLFDALLLLSAVPEFSELKRARGQA
ncbi:DsbA family oxidoreductase [Micromonospora sp. DT31]|uniref:DsbA family oxidoreductase n=1 Tax=Micromonospora sp. DT31 TaxID=3393434 RepID=UPI003CFB91F0